MSRGSAGRSKRGESHVGDNQKVSRAGLRVPF